MSSSVHTGSQAQEYSVIGCHALLRSSSGREILVSLSPALAIGFFTLVPPGRPRAVCCLSHLVVSDPLRPHGCSRCQLLCPAGFYVGKYTQVGRVPPSERSSQQGWNPGRICRQILYPSGMR